MDKVKKEPGIYTGVSFEEYISWDCFHKSMVGPALRSTEHLHHYINSDHRSSKLMDFGSLVDCMLLEPEVFSRDFKERPDTYINSKDKEMPWNMNSNFCKEWMADVRENNITPYSKADYQRSLSVIANIEAHKTAIEWINESSPKYQTAIVWIDEDTGISCKGRIDIQKKDRLCDLKITGNASANEFRRTMNNFLYHVQGAMYTEGWAALNKGELLPWGFIVAESEAPFAVATYNLGAESLITGKHLFYRALRRYKDYLELGPTGYSQLTEEIEIPQWAIDIEDEHLLGDTI